jgi:hypothetical protein
VLLRIGALGTSPGQLTWPTGIAVDAQGSVYVGESLGPSGACTCRVQKFSPSGQLLATWD